MRNKHFKLWMRACAALVLAILAGTQADATPTVATISGGNPTVNPQYQGFRDGNTFTNALYHTPCGLALDSACEFLFVADRDNNAIRYIDLALGNQGLTWTLRDSSLSENLITNCLNKPVAVTVDDSDLMYVLNQGNGTNGSIMTFNWTYPSYYADSVATNAVGLSNAAGMALDKAGNIYVTVQSNKLIRIAAGTTNQTTIATITNAGTSLQGLVVKRNGSIAVCDAGRNGIYLITTNGLVTTNAGFNGAGDFATNGINTALAGKAKFNQPMSVAEAGDGTLIVTDYGNHRVKAVLTSGMVTNLYGITSGDWNSTGIPGFNVYPGWRDGTVKVPDNTANNVESRLPFGVVMSAVDGSLYTSEDYYHIIRKITGTGLPLPPPAIPDVPLNLTAAPDFGQVVLTWSAVPGATNYNIKRGPTSNDLFSATLAKTANTTYTDTNVIKGSTYYYVVSASNGSGEGSNSVVVGATVPIPVPPTPRIGWVDYELNNLLYPWTVIHPIGSGQDNIYHNDLSVAIDPVQTLGLTTRYYAGPSEEINIPAYTGWSGAPKYTDHDTDTSETTLINETIKMPKIPDVMIYAVNIDGTGQASLITQARFQFEVDTPSINGYNGAQFTISDITTNATFWYTIDGSTPSNGPPSIGPLYNTNGSPIQLSISVVSNVVFQVIAYRDGYLPSPVKKYEFTPADFVANTISFGLISGEASSDFKASPGQSFYAPVTLSILPGTKMYSLQFNLTVTNDGVNPGPPVAPNMYSFGSMLKKPHPKIAGLYVPIPPYAFVEYGLGYSNPAPNSQSIGYNGDWFQNLETISTPENLLTVGWVERYGETNLYNTKSQDLITYSMAHDVLYPSASAPTTVILGGYAFNVPITATNGQTYRIQIGAPSATSDGIGAPGGAVYIAAPTNGAPAGGSPINALKYVTVSQLKYIVGDVYPFHWFNAGDFGAGGLVTYGNADVEQVFQSAIYGLNTPPFTPNSWNGTGYTNVSDFFDAMDSCGGTYTNLGHGYLEFNSYVSGTNATNPLFDGNDTSINQIAFGDGQLDICDVYVTFRRSVGPTSLNWFQRYWDHGQRVAQIVPHAQVVSKVATVSSPTPAPIANSTATTNAPLVNFAAGDIQGTAGQAVQIPITATIFGSYPLRVLMLNLTVEPLDGAPALTTPVQFTQTAPLGTPYKEDSRANGNYSAVWLNSSIAGLTGTTTIGMLTVTLPAGVPSNAAYAVHFDHVSASPNGLATFPKQTLTGVITLSSRTNSSYGDGIPDLWRLRWFGTANNYLTLSNACPSGDGINNWKKFVAGVDPTQANNFPSVSAKTPVPANATMAIHWPTVSGKQYVIERSSSLYSGAWSTISTNTGTGADMEFDDPSGGPTHFYRVRIVQ